MANKKTQILSMIVAFMLLQISVFATGGDALSKSAINIFPNPVVYEANISLDKEINLYDNEVSLYFFNIVGEEIYQLESIQDHQFRVNKVHFQKSGIYLYQLQMNGEVLKTGKINIH